MKRKNQNLPLPLELVKQFEKTYPNCWEMVEYVRQGKGKELPNWNDLCYCPLAGTQTVMFEKYHNLDVNEASLLAALASWRQYKEIYSFSEELKETLFAQSEDMVIPTEVLYRIPFPCVYINLDEDEGFFVFFEQDMHTLQMELRFCIVSKTEPMFNTWIHIGENYTISDGISDGIDLMIKNQKKYNLPHNIPKEEIKEYNFDKVSKLFQLVLYICAENAEIEENPEQKKITRKPQPQTKPKDVYREIRSWDVGFKYAYNVRKANAINDNEINDKESNTDLSTADNKHRSHRPHTRRGHWHHYWIGSELSNNRKLILKWTAPIFVGGNSDDTITTIHKI